MYAVCSASQNIGVCGCRYSRHSVERALEHAGAYVEAAVLWILEHETEEADVTGAAAAEVGSQEGAGSGVASSEAVSSTAEEGEAVAAPSPPEAVPPTREVINAQDVDQHEELTATLERQLPAEAPEVALAGTVPHTRSRAHAHALPYHGGHRN
jgi:hypothetical protein